jgi:Flp pilus assembly secretin CpaC
MKKDYLIIIDNIKIFMSRKKQKQIIILSLSLCLVSVYGAMGTDKDNIAVKNYSNTTIIKRQEQLLKAKELVKSAHKNYLNKNYEKAKNLYLSSISILSDIRPGTAANNHKINQLKDALSHVYTSWAKEMLSKAEKLAYNDEIQKAILLCREAKEINPKSKRMADELISKFENRKEYNKYKQGTSKEKLAPKLKEKNYNISVLYEQGKKLMRKKLYSQAKDKFEELLLIDPYNINAIQYIRRINVKTYEAGKYRTEVTSTERQSEVEWKKLSPVISRTLKGNRIDFAEDKVLKKTDKLSPIRKKLNDIIIKHIAFEEVPIDTAILFLKRESQKSDPDGIGINFFLRLSPADIAQSEEGDNEVSWDEESLNEEEMEPADQYVITIVLDNVPMIKAIQYICKAAGLKYRINQYAIEIASQNIPFEDLETRVFPVDKEIFNHLDSNTSADLKAHYQQRGVEFAEGSTIIYDSKISRLIVRNTQQEIAKIKILLDRAEETLPQISIASKFVEMQQKDFDELGFQWNFANPNGGGTTWDAQQAINQYANDANGDYKIPDREFGFSWVNSGIQLDAAIHALNQNTKVEVLSAPRVTTLSGHKATIRLIEDRYFPTEWSEPELTTTLGGTSETRLTVPSVPTLDYDEPTPVGVVLEATPYVSSDKYTIDLILEPQVQTFVGWTDYNIVSSTEATTSDSTVELYSKIKMAKISARTIQTQIRIYDGETVVMGGVYKDNTTDIDDRIPLLGEIPLIGRLFRSEIEDIDKTNLLIFTSVKLVKPDGTPLRPYQNRGFPKFRD